MTTITETPAVEEEQVYASTIAMSSTKSSMRKVVARMIMERETFSLPPIEMMAVHELFSDSFENVNNDQFILAHDVLDKIVTSIQEDLDVRHKLYRFDFRQGSVNNNRIFYVVYESVSKHDHNVKFWSRQAVLLTDVQKVAA